MTEHSKRVRSFWARNQTEAALRNKGQRSKALLGSTHNRAKGLTKEEADRLDEILNRYTPVTEEFK